MTAAASAGAYYTNTNTTKSSHCEAAAADPEDYPIYTSEEVAKHDGTQASVVVSIEWEMSSNQRTENKTEGVARKRKQRARGRSPHQFKLQDGARASLGRSPDRQTDMDLTSRSRKYGTQIQYILRICIINEFEIRH